MKKTVMVLAIIFMVGKVAAQNDQPAQPRIMFGFNIGLNYTNLQSAHNSNVSLHNGPGFRLGLLGQSKITERLNFCPKTELVFNEASVSYPGFQNAAAKESLVYPVNMDIMMHLNYTLSKRKNPLYILAGPNLRVPFLDRKNPRYPYANNPDLAIDLGIGLEQHLKYFILAPELRYSFGLLNINKDPSLSKVYFHNISLVLNFKG